MRRRRLRKWSKWVSTAAAGLVAAGWLANGWCSIWWVVQSDAATAPWGLYLVDGRIEFEPHVVDLDTGLVATGSHEPSWEWCLPWWYPSPEEILYLPLWAPFLLTAIPAALLWYNDRRRFGPGFCTKCGYPRTGLAATTPCPECGTSSMQHASLGPSRREGLGVGSLPLPSTEAGRTRHAHD